jgi:hypothetical protein
MILNEVKTKLEKKRGEERVFFLKQRKNKIIMIIIYDDVE